LDVIVNEVNARPKNNSYYYFDINIRMIYQTLALSIRIQGLQNRPLRNEQHDRPLRNSIKLAIEHFKRRFPDVKILSQYKFERLVSIPLFISEHFELISRNFQRIVLMLGDCVAGDEKLFRFTGDSKDIRLVFSKPDRIGLWFYQLCSPTASGGSYLLWAKLHDSDPSIGRVLSVSVIVNSWTNIVQTIGQPETILTMDSYYLDRAGKNLLAASQVKYIAAITEDRFKPFYELTQPKITKRGEWTGLYNPNSSEIVVLYYSNDKNIGKKMVISNCMVKSRGKLPKELIPVYDLYKLTFRACDIYNSQLCDCTWPHKKGGKDTPGDLGVHHDFILSCILQNVFNYYTDLRRIPVETQDFCDLCLNLADELFEFTK